jgi:hypothetical protein
MLFYYNYALQECARFEKQQLLIIYVIFGKIAITLAPGRAPDRQTGRHRYGGTHREEATGLSAAGEKFPPGPDRGTAGSFLPPQSI